MSAPRPRKTEPAYAARLARHRKRAAAPRRGPDPAAERPEPTAPLTSAQKTASQPPLCCTAVAQSQRFLSL